MTSYDVKEIGYAFLKTYYERMHNNPSKLSCLYSTTAELTHINYNEPNTHEKDYLETLKLIGKDNINYYFTRNSKRVQDLKVKIDSCDFQSTGYESSSILILTLGELCWTNSPSYRFCQCFILEPAEYNSKIYDLKNDIIRFIPDLLPLKNVGSYVGASNDTAAKKSVDKPIPKSVDDKQDKQHQQLKEENTSSLSSSSTTSLSGVAIGKAQEENKKGAEIPKRTTANQPISTKDNAGKPSLKNGEQRNNVGNEKSSVHSTQAEAKSEQNLDHKRQEPTGKQVSESSVSLQSQKLGDDLVSIDKSILSSPHDVSIETAPSDTIEVVNNTKTDTVKMTWAGKLNKTSKLTTNYIRVDLASKKSKSPPPNGFTKSSKKVKQPGKPVGEVIIQNSNGYYPVYVGNTNGLSATELEKALIKEYGEVVKTSFQDSFAVVDFREKSARDAAIEAQHLRVGDKTINLNPKEERGSKYGKAKSNNNTNSNSGNSSPSPSSGFVSSSQNTSSLKKNSMKSRNDKSKN